MGGRTSSLLDVRFTRTLAALCALCMITSAGAVPGDLDTAFYPGTQFDGRIYMIKLLPDGKILVGGDFTGPSVPFPGFLELLPAGGVDNFWPSFQRREPVYAVVVQTNGMIIAARGYSPGIARLASNGSFDTAFTPGTGPNDSIHSMALQPDGKILIGGMFTNYNGSVAHHLARLNGDGTLDNSFKVEPGANDHVMSIALQPDGRIVMGGNLSSFDGAACNLVARANSDGSFDTNFVAPFFNSYVTAIALQPDGKILVAGYFNVINGLPHPSIARLNADGSLDPDFKPGSGPISNYVQSIALQPDGKILIGGIFNSVDGQPREQFARLNADGSVDLSFIPKGIIDSAGVLIRAIAVQSDGKALIGGSLGVARVLLEDSPSLEAPTLLSNGSVRLTGTAATNAHLQVQASTNFLNWQVLGRLTNYTGKFSFTDATSSQLPNRYYRVLWMP
jgi:uncharacterized delta-60 repeat protein